MDPTLAFPLVLNVEKDLPFPLVFNVERTWGAPKLLSWSADVTEFKALCAQAPELLKISHGADLKELEGCFATDGKALITAARKYYSDAMQEPAKLLEALMRILRSSFEPSVPIDTSNIKVGHKKFKTVVSEPQQNSRELDLCRCVVHGA